MNYSKGFPFIFITQVVYAACIFLTYPINLFPVYTIILNSRLSKNYINRHETESGQPTNAENGSEEP